MQLQIQSRCARRWTAQSRRFGEFRSENHSIGCRWVSERLTVEVGWQDRERWQEVFRSSLMCSQSESYKIRSGKPEFNSSTVKKVTYLFGLPLAKLGLLDAAETQGPGVAGDDIVHLLFEQFAVINSAQQPSSKRIEAPGGDVCDQ